MQIDSPVCLGACRAIQAGLASTRSRHCPALAPWRVKPSELSLRTGIHAIGKIKELLRLLREQCGRKDPQHLSFAKRFVRLVSALVQIASWARDIPLSSPTQSHLQKSFGRSLGSGEGVSLRYQSPATGADLLFSRRLEEVIEVSDLLKREGKIYFARLFGFFYALPLSNSSGLQGHALCGDASVNAGAARPHVIPELIKFRGG